MKSYSTLLPSLKRDSSAYDSKLNIALKPSLHRIHYPPLSDSRAKENKHSMMVQSCITNVTLSSPSKGTTTSSIKNDKKR